MIHFQLRFISSLLLLLFTSNLYAEIAGKPIISNISTNRITIDATFTGQKIMLFGNKNEVGEVIINITGPKSSFMVNKKEKKFGIWYNAERVLFDDIYTYYKNFSTVNNVVKNDELAEFYKNFEVGIGNLNINHSVITGGVGLKTTPFKFKLMKYFYNNELYDQMPQYINFLDDALFNIDIVFPEKIRAGEYMVNIYLVNDQGTIIGSQFIPIIVEKAGMNAKIYDFANKNSLLYSLISLIIAMFFGWFANYVFKRLYPCKK